MKRKLLFVFLFLSFLFFLSSSFSTKPVQAQGAPGGPAPPNCQIYDVPGKITNGLLNGEYALAAYTNQSGDIGAYYYLPGLPGDWINTNEGWIAINNGPWTKAITNCGGDRCFFNISYAGFSTPSEYRITSALVDTLNGNVAMCSVRVVAYDRENLGSWSRTVNSPDVATYNLVSSKGWQIGGVYDGGDGIGSFTHNSPNTCRYSDPDYYRCGYYSPWFSSNKYIDRYVFGHFWMFESGDQDHATFTLASDDRCQPADNCYAKVDIWNTTLYVRPHNVPTAGPTKTPPSITTTVYGYVKDSSKAGTPGIPGAKVQVQSIDNSTGSCSGAHTGCAGANSDVVTDSSGRFQVNCTVPMKCLAVVETQNATGYNDSSKLPDGPAGSGATNSNIIMWNNPPIGSLGPFNIYDVSQSTTTPIPTLTPSLPTTSCPLGKSQTEGAGQLGLNNQYKEYVPFTLAQNSLVNKIAIKAGNYGGAWRSLTCKVTNSIGSVNISAEKSSAQFRSDTGVQWREIDFLNSPFSLSANTTYRLYCKAPDSWNSLYWVWGWPNTTDGKTYRLYTCPK